MKENLSIDVSHLIGENDKENFIPVHNFESFTRQNGPLFDEFRSSLKNQTSPITRPFLEETPLSDIRRIAGEWRQKYENLLILGIGGSTMGFRAILQAVKGPFYNVEALSHQRPRVFVLDNLDPFLAHCLGSRLDFKKTAILYISKSGSTPEPAANFVYFYKKYIDGGGRARDLVFICDPADNGMNRIAKKLGCRVLPIPGDLPGRYTVLSPAGFLPAEVVNISSRDLLDGAAAVHRSILDTHPRQNAVFILGSCLFELAQRGKSIHVIFNYSNTLSDFGLWLAQLWAESLGKKKSLRGDIVHAGTTPLTCLGATDQHSLLQLFKEGPNDKVFGFVTIENFPDDIRLPNPFPEEKEYSYFGGHKMSRQLKIEQVSTEASLKRSNRPCYRILLPEISAFTLGGLFYFMECLVVFTAGLWEINPFDQPGVEEGKAMTYSLMGREDYAGSRLEYQQELDSLRDHPRLFKL